MGTRWPIGLTTDFAQAYYQAASQGANMRLATNALETIRETLQGNQNHIEVRYVMDDQIGRADLERLAPVLVKLRERICAMLDAREVERLRRLYEKDVNEGWQAWLLTYTLAFSEWGWYTLFCRKIAQEALMWAPEHAPSIKQIRHYTKCAHYARWPETHDWFLFLSQQDLPKEQRGHMLATAAEIQIYHFYQPSKGQALLKQAESLIQSYRIDQVWGEYYLQTEQPELARPYFERIIASKPYLSTGYVNLGDYFAKVGDLRAADEQYEQAVENAPGLTGGYQSLAELLTKVDWYPDREARLQGYLERMQVLSDDPAAPYSTIGGVYRTLGDYEKAARHFNESLEIDREEYNAYISLGHLEIEQAGRVADAEDQKKHIDLAEQTFSKLLKLAPRSLSGYWGMMFVDLQKNELDGALQWLKKGRRCHKEWATYIESAQGELLRRQGRLAQAKRALLKSLKRETYNPSVLSSLRSLSDDYKPEDANIALRLLDIWREHSSPAEEYTYQNQVGNVWYYHEDYERAEQHYRLGIAANSKSDVLYSNLALALERRKAPGRRLDLLQEALSALEKAIELKRGVDSYTTRHEKMKMEHDFIAAYGEAALSYEHVVTPIRLAGEVETISYLLNESRDALSDRSLQMVEAFRKRVQERRGILAPPVLVSFLQGNDIPPGKYLISLRERPVEEGMLEGEEDVADGLLELLERVVESHLAVLVGYQETVNLLANCNSDACRSILTSPRLVALCMQVLVALLHNGHPVKEIEQIAARVLQMSQKDQSSEQIAAGIMQAALAESE